MTGRQIPNLFPGLSGRVGSRAGVGSRVVERVCVCLRGPISQKGDVAYFVERACGLNRRKSVGLCLYTLLGETIENASEGSCDGTTYG